MFSKQSFDKFRLIKTKTSGFIHKVAPKTYYSSMPPYPTPLITSPSLEKRKTIESQFTALQPNASIEEMVDTLTHMQKECVMRFYTGAMSFGSISYEAHTAIAEGVNRLAMAVYGVTSLEELKKLPHFSGPISNSGEGGELVKRNKTLQQSLKRQIASARFGVNGEYLAHAIELEIKINQGAKPGIGGELPGQKVTEFIAQARLTTPGITLASPPPHHDIYSIEDLKQLIRDLRTANPLARIAVKLAASSNLGVIAAGVVKCGADIINIAGPGGTGAAPTTAKYEFVHPWELALAQTHQTLKAQGMRDHVKLIISGGIQTGKDAFDALLLGADGIETGTGVLVSLGCIMAEVCHDGSCPTGIATNIQTKIDASFKGTPEDVARSLIQTALSLSHYLERYGFTNPQQAIGRTDLLRAKNHSPLSGLEQLLYKPNNPFPFVTRLVKDMGSSNEEQGIIKAILEEKNQFEITASTHVRSFGARIGYHAITDLQFHKAYYKKPVIIRCNGLAMGQSFGFVAPPNLTLIAQNTNDGTGKSLDGGVIYVQNQTGNYAGFGGTRGCIYVKKTGGRAATRNSGVDFVTEECGPDAAGFMTGGSFTLLGDSRYYPGLDLAPSSALVFKKNKIGYNFGSGFSGGLVFMPRALYNEMTANQFLAPSAREIKAQTLSKVDTNALIQRIKDYTKEINSDIASALLRLEKKTLQQFFIKLDPLVSNLKLSQRAQKNAPLTNQERLQYQSTSTVSRTKHKPTKTKSLSTSLSKGLFDPSIAPKDSCGTGVLVNRNGLPSTHLVNQTLTMLARFEHRGASGVDPETGDGCGITFYGLDQFFQQEFVHLHLKKGHYAIVHVALPKAPDEAIKARELLLETFKKEKIKIVDERKVPVNSQVLGYLGQSCEPHMVQCVILKPIKWSQTEFEKALIRAHLCFEFTIQEQMSQYQIRPHIISAGVEVIYKSMAKESLFKDYFLDFKNPLFKANAAAVHSRFSTNTLPSFMNIQMFRNLGNNGENNALEQVIWALSKDPLLKNLLGLESINLQGFSDSHLMSIYMDLLRLKGYSPEEIVALTIHPYDPAQSATSEYYNQFGLPFEGPNASIITIGSDKILVTKDRNGFRPQRGCINAELFYCGSELGAVDMEGEVFDLEPASPLVIHLNTGEVNLYQPTAQKKQFHEKQMDLLTKLSFNNAPMEPAPFADDILKQRKLIAGWTQELDQKMMQPLFQEGKDPIVSMGDQRPIEALIDGPNIDLGAFFKGKFSQVTNPALDSKREKEYMSTRVFVGCKPSLPHIGKELVDGFLLASPILSNQEMALLSKNPVLRTHEISTTFLMTEHDAGLQYRINQISQEAIAAVKAGARLIVLSDLLLKTNHAAIPPVIIASVVHNELTKAGLRRQVSIGLQAASILTPRDMAQAISIGGVDIINPYLTFMIDSSTQDITAFKKQCQTYQKACLEGILGFMARMGISTLSAYRGCKGFNAYGLNPELTQLLGIQGELGGLGLNDITTLVINQHKQPINEGLGRLNPQSKMLSKIWNEINTINHIQRARGKKGNEIEEKMDLLRRGSVRGQFFLTPPLLWNSKNPMPVCILGGGASGFYQAQLLLKSNVPVHITIIEKNPINRVGLVGEGVAPDHVGTKNQTHIFSKLLHDPRLEYFGGIEIDKDVSFEVLKTQYPCLIDCRGAPHDLKLKVPGIESHRVLTASQAYLGYNQTLHVTPSDQNYWPLFQTSKNPEIGIIGDGNVAADLARVFLKKPSEFDKSSMNPAFLALLKTSGPDCIRIFALGGPTETKISLNQLMQLKQLPNLCLSARFDESQIDVNQLDANQKSLYTFFLAIKDQEPHTTQSKSLCFHFNSKITAFKEHGNEVEAIFTGLNGEFRCRSRAFITAIGKQAMSLEHIDNIQIYASGWVTGRGGNLTAAELSAQETTLTIKDNFEKGLFHHKKIEPTALEWQLKSVIGNKEQLNLLEFLKEGFRINNLWDFRNAKQYQNKLCEIPQTLPKISEQSHTTPTSTELLAKDTVHISDSQGNVMQINPESGKTLLTALRQKGLILSCDCDGAGKCGTCNLKAQKSTEEITTENEKDILVANGEDPGHAILACLHQVEDLTGRMFFSPVSIKEQIEKENSTKPRLTIE